MKTLILKSLFLVAALIQMSTLMSCSSGGGGGSTPAATYYMGAGNQCYNNLNQPVTLSLCSTSGYSLNTLGQCVNTQTQQIATQTLCTASGNGIAQPGYGIGANGQCVLLSNQTPAPSSTYCGQTGIGGSQICIGQYTWMSPYGGSQTGMCQQGYNGINNCSGYSMRNSAGQTVLCQ